MDALNQRSHSDSENYPNYDPEDLSNINQQNAHQLQKKYGNLGSNIGSLEQAMEADHGLTPGSAMIDYSTPKDRSTAGNTRIDKNGAIQMQVDPNEDSGNFLDTMNHEMNHAQEMKYGTSRPIWNQPTGPSDSNAKPHFGEDFAGQMFPYEARNALELMGNQLEDQNNPQPGLLNNYGPEGLALQSYLQKKQQMGELSP